MPRHIHRHAMLLRRPLQLREVRPILGRVPRIDRALVERLRFVRNDQVEIEVDRIAESLAARAGAKRIVEREQPRLRLAINPMASLALERRREAQPLALELRRVRAEQSRIESRPTRDIRSPPHPRCAHDSQPKRRCDPPAQIPATRSRPPAAIPASKTRRSCHFGTAG